MRKCTVILFVAVLAVPLCAAEKFEPTGPMAISKWSIRWDRFKQKAIVDTTFSNTSVKRVSDLSVVLEFSNDKGKVVKRSLPWRKSGVAGRTTIRMKLRIHSCPPFSKYLVKITGSLAEPFEQLFEGMYWPDKPGDTPDMPQPIAYAKGMADVRVVGARTEYLRIRKGKEALRISGTLRNMGDVPAEKVVITITMLNKKKGVWAKDIPIKTPKLAPGATAPFSVIVKRLPHHTSIVYHVDFDSTKTMGGSTTIEKFDIEAGSLMIKDCIVDPKTGLFTGTLINRGEKAVSGVAINISIEKAGATTVYTIKPGGNVDPGDRLPLIKATMPGFDTFGVAIEFQEQ